MTKLEELAQAYAEAKAEQTRLWGVYELLEEQEDEWESRKALAYQAAQAALERSRAARDALLEAAKERKP